MAKAKGQKVQFDIQTFLSEMDQRQEHRTQAVLDEVKKVDGKVEEVKQAVNGHEVRLVTVEGTRKTILWLAGALVTALLTGAGDVLFNHLPRVLASR